MADTIQNQSGEDHTGNLQKGINTAFEALLKKVYPNVDAYDQSHYQEVAHILKKMLVANNVLLTKDKVVALKKNNVETLLCIVFDQDGEFDTDWLNVDYLDEQNGVMVDGNRDIVYCSSSEECQEMLKTLNTLPQQYSKELKKKATIEVEDNLKKGVSTTGEKRKRVVQKTEQRKNKIVKLEDKIRGLHAEIRARTHEIQEIRDAQKAE